MVTVIVDICLSFKIAKKYDAETIFCSDFGPVFANSKIVIVSSNGLPNSPANVWRAKNEYKELLYRVWNPNTKGNRCCQ